MRPVSSFIKKGEKGDKMYPVFQCKACNREEYAFKTVMLEDCSRVCASCYYDAIDRETPALMDLKQLMDSQILAASLINARNRYLSTLRKYSIFFEQPPLIVMEEFMKLEISISQDKFGVKRKDIGRKKLHELTTYMKNVMIPAYFGDTIPQDVLKLINPGDYYTHKDYEDKLRTMLR